MSSAEGLAEGAPPGARARRETLAGADGDREVRHARLLLAALLVVALALRLPGFTEPYSGKGFNSFLGAFGSAAFARFFDENGFVEAGFMPYRWRLELVDGTVEHGWYAHHPVGYALVTGLAVRLLGNTEWVTRLPWLAVALVSVLALHRLFRELWGERVALAATAVYAFLPVAVHYSLMTWVDNGAMLTVYALVLVPYVRWVRDEDPKGLRRAALWVLVGGLVDWTVGFLLLGIGLHALVVCARSGGWPRLRRTLILPLAFPFAFLVHGLHMLLVIHWDHIVRDTDRTLERTTRLGQPLLAYLGLQVDHLERGLTVGVLALCAAGLVWQLVRIARGRIERGEGVLFALLLPGPLYVACFPFRGVTHDFLWLLSCGWFAATCALVLLALRRLLARALGGRGATGLVAAGALVLAVLATRRSLEAWREDRGTLLVDATRTEWFARSFGDPDAVVIAPLALCSLLYYSEATLLPRIVTPGHLEETRRELLSRVPPSRPVWYVYLAAPGGGVANRELLEYLRAHAEPQVFGEQGDVILFDLTAWAHG